MANVLKADKKLQILRLLCEGNSIRSTARLVGSQIHTVLRQLQIFGEKARDFLDRNLRDLTVKHVQCDEIWTFVKKKEKQLTDDEKASQVLGDQYLFIAFDQHTKLICTYAIGRRTAETTAKFTDDLSRRIRIPDYKDIVAGTAVRPQLSTDGWQAYPDAIASAFGQTVKYGVLIKNYVEPNSGRYAPPEMVKADRLSIQGDVPLRSICTSHVERNNLTIRTFLKRFARLSLGFSKKRENLAAAVAIHVYYYNFCRIHGTLKRTPALAAGVTDRLWSLEDLIAA